MASTRKLTIMWTIAQLFVDQDRPGTSFFFKKGEGDYRSTSKLFTTVATNLITYIPGIAPIIRIVIDSDPIIAEKNLKD